MNDAEGEKMKDESKIRAGQVRIEHDMKQERDEEEKKENA